MVAMVNVNAFFSLFSKFLETFSVYSSDTDSVSVYVQPLSYPNPTLLCTHSIQT